MSLFKHYYITTHLAHTSLYDTYLAYPADNPEHSIVLKVFDAQCILPTATHADFQRLERRLQSLQHPHIVAILALGKEQGKPYLVSEYQPGDSLRQHLDHLSPEHLSLEDAVTLVMQVGQAVAFAHTQEVLHEDIRPENILLNDHGQALLTNFSLGNLIREPGPIIRSDRRAASYLSPEQTIGIANQASDQYALGCLLYELVTGTLPNLLALQQPSPLVPTLPQKLETVILRALALTPEARYPSVTTFLAELKQATQPEPSLSPHIMENEPISTLHYALAAHAYITSLDAFSQYEPAENVSSVVPPEDFLAITEKHAISSKKDQQHQPHYQEEQLASQTAQDTPSNTPTEVQSAEIVRPPYAWKRPAGVIGAVVVALLAITLLLVYSYNAGVRPGVKHTLAVATSVTISSQTTTPSTSVQEVTTKPIVTQKPTARAIHHHTTTSTASGTTPSAAPSPIPTATPQPPGIGSVQIDSGGSGAGSFVGDEDFSNTTPGRPSSASNDSSSVIDTSGVSDPAPESVYQSARIGDCLYTISHLTPYARYTVRLHFAETYWTRPGQRTFDVTLNAHLVLHNFDILATAGGENKAVVEQFVVPADNTGTITIQFQTVKDNAQINGIEVLAV